MDGKFLTALVVLFIYLQGTIYSQQVELSPPKDPVIARLPAAASWTMDYKYKSDERNAAPGTDVSPTPKPNPRVFSDKAKQVTVLKKNQVWNEKTLWKSGTQTDLWIFEGMRLIEQPGTGVISSKPFVSENRGGFDYRGADFEGLEWVSAATYKGVVKYLGKPAYLFEFVPDGGSAMKKIENPAGLWGKNRVALISPETDLPLFYYDGRSERTYGFGAAPSSPLIPPEKFMTLFEEIKRSSN